jgi:S-adenosylmethionine/arginine decarboxylase-like enzyme
MKNGTIILFAATLEYKDPNAVKMDELKDWSIRAIKALGLGFRRFSVENYKEPKNAYTLVCFLDESHFMITTYPEHKMIEVEFGSCKEIESLTKFISFLTEKDKFSIHSSVVLEKDNEDGRWKRGF